jgi:tetratricopeptide (TPR) repeat protein
MTDAGDNRNLWSQTFDRKVSDVQSLQTDISHEIVDNLRLRLSGAETEQLGNSGTASTEAYEMLLKGRFYNNKVGTENRKKAAEFFQKAIDVDPKYALAYAELSLTYSNLVGYSNYDPKTFMPKAESAAQRAIELDPSLPEAPYALAAIQRFAWRWADAEKTYKHAIELNPNLARVHNGYALFLSVMRRDDEAIAEIKHAREFDPVSVLINLNMGVIYISARRYDEAIEILNKTLELDQNVPFIHIYLGIAYSEKQMHDKAIDEVQEAIRLNESTPKTQILLGTAFANAGRTAEAQGILRQLQSNGAYVSPAELAILYDSLRDRDAAFKSLENAFAEYDLQLQYLEMPTYDGLRSDKRFQDLVRRIGLPQ